MTKKQILIIIGVVIIIGALGIIVWQRKGPEMGKGKIPDDLSFRKEKRVELINELLKVNSFEECDFVSKQIIELGPICEGSMCSDPEQFYWAYMTQCMGNLAAKENNFSLCEDEVMLDKIISEKRKMNQPISPNEKTFLRQQCVLSFVRNLEDLSDFDKNLESLCNQFEKSDRDECFYYLAIVSKNHNFCSNISNHINQGRCFTYFAFRNHDQKICHGEDWQIESCKEAINILNNNQVSFCETLGRFYDTAGGPPLEECYIGFALYKQDPSICNNIKWKYIYGLGRESFDFYLCKKLSLKNEKTSEPIKGEIRFFTDKTEYKQGQKIKISVTNRLDKNIYWREIQCGASFW